MIESLPVPAPPPSMSSRSKSLPPKTSTSPSAHAYTQLHLFDTTRPDPIPQSSYQVAASARPMSRLLPKAHTGNYEREEPTTREQQEYQFQQEHVPIVHNQQKSTKDLKTSTSPATLPRLQTKTGWRPLHQSVIMNAVSAAAAEPALNGSLLSPPWKSANEVLYETPTYHQPSSCEEQETDGAPLGPLFYSPIQRHLEENLTLEENETITSSIFRWFSQWLHLKTKVESEDLPPIYSKQKLPRPKSLPPLLNWSYLTQRFGTEEETNDGASPVEDEEQESHFRSKSAIDWGSDAFEYQPPLPRRYSYGGHARQNSQDSIASSLQVGYPNSSLSPLVDSLDFNPWQTGANYPSDHHPRAHQRFLRRNSSIHRRQRSEPSDVFNSPPSELASWGSRASYTWSPSVMNTLTAATPAGRIIEEQQQWMRKRGAGRHQRFVSTESTSSKTSTASQGSGNVGRNSNSVSGPSLQNLSSFTMTFDESGLDSFPKLDSFRQHRRRRSAVDMLTPFFQSVSGSSAQEEDQHETRSDPSRHHSSSRAPYRFSSRLRTSGLGDDNSAGLPSPSVFLGVPTKHYVPLEFRTFGLAVTVDAPRVPAPQNRVSGFTTYTVTVKLLKRYVPGFENDRSMVWSVQKRYKEFRDLYLTLKRKHPAEFESLPSLPPRIFFGRFVPQVVSERAQAFNAILSCMALNQVLQLSPTLVAFLKSSAVDPSSVPSVENILSAEAASPPTRFDENIMERSISLHTNFNSSESTSDATLTVHRSRSLDSLALTSSQAPGS